MISSGFYVYITLPGQTSAVTAGRFELKKNKNGVAIGRFVYGKKYLERQDAVPLDPLQLKLAKRVYETTQLNGVFGAIRDAGPDYWGRRIIERHVGKQDLSELDYLLYSPEDRAGALSFGLNQPPPAPRQKFNQTLELAFLQQTADAIINSNLSSSQIEELLLIGTSMGGARPKVVVEDLAGLWLAKFNRLDDLWNFARVEHAMLSLGRSCGLITATSRVVSVAGRDVLLVKRFDREKINTGYLKARMISALTLLGTEDTYQVREKWSYVLLAEELRRVSSNPEQDAIELFKRMCFNALISNTDDHPRNHALIAKDFDWRLSPAYDLIPGPLVSLERRDLALDIGAWGRYANAHNILSNCERFLLKPEKAKNIVDTMKKQVKESWYSVARSCGVSEKDCETISGAFVYPGFSLHPS